ncbi:MAG: AAA family ATPase [Micromonosporaceae bacterium]|nr:AAA family ATPase [Micromonosporaceae bacterium]
MFARAETRSPLVGRDQEIRLLDQAFAALAEGAGGCLVFTGPAGIGKSRLADLVVTEARGRGLAVALGRAAELDRDTPLTSLRSALAHARPRPLVAGPARADESRLQQIERLGEMIESTARPIAITIDDAQWIDETTALALRMLVPQLASAPVLWVLTRRPLPTAVGLRGAIDWLIGNGWAQEHEVAGLDAEAVADLCRHLAGATPDATVLDLADRARGNPLLIELTLTTLITSGQIVVVDSIASVVGDDLPEGLYAAARQLLRELSPAARDLLGAGAVLGRPFSIHEAESVQATAPGHYLAAAREALAARVLREEGTQLAFAHDLLRDAVYDGMPLPIRAALHHRAASVVRAAGRSALEEAEHHLRSGPDGPRAAVQAVRDAARQLAPHAPATAADLMLRVIDRLDHDDPIRAQLSAEAVELVAASGQVDRAQELARWARLADLDRATEATALLGLAEALKHAGQNALAVRYATEALSRDGVPDGIRARLHAVAAHALLWGEDMTLADEAGAQAVRIGTSAGEFAAVVFGQAARSVVARAEGRLTDAYDHAASAVALADEHGRQARHRHPRIWLGSALTALDRLDEARQVLQEGRAEADLLGTAWSAPLWHFYLAWTIGEAGDLDGARAEAEAGLLRAGQLAALQLAIPLHGLLVRIAVLRDELPEARHQLRSLRLLLDGGRSAAPEDLAWAAATLHEADDQPAEALAVLSHVYEQLPGRLLSLSDRPGRGPTLVRLALAAGDRGRAEAAAAASQALAERNGTIASVVGAAAHARGLLDGDREALREAVRLLAASPRPVDRAQAEEDCARAEFPDDRERAVRLLESAVRTYAECGARRLHRRAARTLRQWGIRRAPVAIGRGDAAAFGLTPTELRVAQEAANGKTNREIATALFMAPGTVDTHLRSIFRKTGVRSRAALGRILPTEDAPGPPPGPRMPRQRAGGSSSGR